MAKKKPNKDNTENKQVIKIALVSAGVILFLFCIFIIGYYLFEKKYHDKIYPNITISGESVSGQTFMQVLDDLDAAQDEFYNKGLTFQYQDETLTIPTTYIKDEVSGISVDILNIDTNATADQAYQVGRNSDFKSNLWQKLKLLFASKNIDLQYYLDQEELAKLLENKFSEFEDPAQNAALSFTSSGNVLVLDEQSGQAFSWDKAVAQVKNNIISGDNQNINLALEDDEPEVKKADTDPLVDEVESLLALAPLTLKHEEQSWEFAEDQLQDWLKFSADGVVLHEDNVTVSLEEIADEIDQPVKEGKFSLTVTEDESIKVEQFQEGENGLEIKPQKTKTQIQESWIDNQKTVIDIVVEVIEPKATPENMDNLGIKELLGTGTTNFSGSPSNRIYNIKKGAEILNGLLIAPGETFSLVTTLGHIDGDAGWLPELVIKENKTIPEFGGGLCQIGTTSFRTAMMSGLEIVERQNHSYAVSYYDYKGKPGVDATIYEPKPDFRFKNNTEHYILWRSRIEGSDIYFEFWGTSDGRSGSFTEPENYNWVSPPATITTEVDTLAPGQLNCTEKAHTGLSASFDYIIDWASGEQSVQTFTSVYKALPAICEKGKEKQTEDNPEEKVEEDKQNPASSDEDAVDNSNTNSDKKKNNNKNKKQS